MIYLVKNESLVTVLPVEFLFSVKQVSYSSIKNLFICKTSLKHSKSPYHVNRGCNKSKIIPLSKGKSKTNPSFLGTEAATDLFSNNFILPSDRAADQAIVSKKHWLLRLAQGQLLFYVGFMHAIPCLRLFFLKIISVSSLSLSVIALCAIKLSRLNLDCFNIIMMTIKCDGYEYFNISNFCLFILVYCT